MVNKNYEKNKERFRKKAHLKNRSETDINISLQNKGRNFLSI